MNIGTEIVLVRITIITMVGDFKEKLSLQKTVKQNSLLQVENVAMDKL